MFLPYQNEAARLTLCKGEYSGRACSERAVDNYTYITITSSTK